MTKGAFGVRWLATALAAPNRPNAPMIRVRSLRLSAKPKRWQATALQDRVRRREAANDPFARKSALRLSCIRVARKMIPSAQPFPGTEPTVGPLGRSKHHLLVLFPVPSPQGQTCQVPDAAVE